MNIALVSSAESELDILPELGEFLKAQITNVSVQVFYAPTTLGIPATVKPLTDSDLVFVFMLVEKEDADIEIMKEKLVDLELRQGMKIIIAVEAFEDTEEAAASKKELVAKWGRYIIDRLYHKEKFKPGYEPSEEPGEEP